VTKTPWRFLGLAPGVLLVGAMSAIHCSASRPSTKAATPPAAPPLSRTNPNIVEEDDLHIVERFPKNQYIRVDDHHFRSPIIISPVEFFKEDETYYYVFTYKRTAETLAVDKAIRAQTLSPTPPPPATTPAPAGPPLTDFEDISPAREPGRIRLEEVSATGLPTTGLWRASFVVADMNGDGIPDIVSPASRIGESRLHVWIGNGKGNFSPWTLQFTENGKPAPAFSVDYGAVAVGDIDGDGFLDIASASHGFGLVSLFGNGKGTFRVVRTGLPTRDFSTQAIALVDVDGDGKLDIVASTDVFSGPSNDQIRVYLYRSDKTWTYKPDGLVRGTYSNILHAWDFDKDGKRDILTGSNHFGALELLWRNLGNGRFEPVSIPDLEIYAYHFATAPGTFGKKRVPAFADAYYMVRNETPQTRATGITLYSFEEGNWIRHRVWRKKSGLSLQNALALGDLDGDGLDDIVFADSEVNRLRIFFQKPDGTFVEAAEKEEPELNSPGQCIRLADLDGDGRLDVIVSKTVASYRPGEQGGWSVYLNRR
jgi:hypothetical protein